MPALALTFDDGPDPVWTPRLLDVLGRAGARATFFPMAPRAAAQPELVARMRAEGHVVGLHCHEHTRHTERSEAWVREDVRLALDELAAVGVRPELWRPPYGVRAEWTAGIAAAHGLALVHWTADTHDWRGDSVAAMLAALAGELVEGAVVLAHDGLGPGVHRADPGETVAFTERLLAEGFASEPLSLPVPAAVA